MSIKEGEIITIEESLPVAADNQDPMLSMIDRVCSDPNFDISKFEKMVDMRNADFERVAKKDYAAAIALMQSELPTVAYDKDGHNSRYASFDKIKKSVSPILSKYGFKDLYFIKQDEKQVCVTVKLMHKSGHSEETQITLPHETSGNKNAVQAIGSTISYGRRYALLSILGVATGDDNDGERFIESVTAKKIKLILEENPTIDISQFLKDMKADCVDNILSKDFEKANIALGRRLKEQKALFKNQDENETN